MTTTIVFKICTLADWQRACENGAYTGSLDDVRDGFIHLSARHQLAGTAAKHFRGVEDLVLVALDADRLAPPLRWEASRGGDLFPHHYAPLPTAAALWTRPLPLGDDKVPLIPEDLL